MRKVLFVVGVSLVGVGAATALLRKSAARPAAASHATATADSAFAVMAGSMPAGEAARPPAMWHVGDRHRYALQSRMDFGQNEHADGPAASASWSGTLEATVLAVRENQATLSFLIKSPVFSAGNADGASQRIPAVERELSLPFAATYDLRGSLQNIHLSGEVTASTQPLIRGLLANTQFTVPPQADAPTWTAQELDSSGEYLAAYSRSAGTGNYSKRKLKYLRTMGPKGLTPEGARDQRVLSSNTTFGMGTDGQLARLRSLEASGLHTGGEGGDEQAQFTVKVSLSLELLAHDVVSAADLGDPLHGSVASGVVLATTRLAGPGGQGDRDLVGSATLPSLMTDLGALPKDAAKDRAALQSRMSALFRTNPGSIDDATARIRGHHPETQVLAAALAAAGSAPAQAALVDLALDSSVDKAGKEQVLANLVALDTPNAQTVQHLQPLLADADPEVRAQAGLAIGVGAHKLEETNPDLALSSTKELLGLFTKSQTEEETLWAIRSIGNSGNVAGLPTLKTVLGTGNDALREAAAQALRLIPGAEADQLLAQIMLKDPSDTVRRAAVFAARFRDVEAMAEPVAAVEHNDASEVVRQLAIETLGRMARSSNSPLLTLQWASTQDANSQNREMAKQILEGLPPPDGT